jgi:hypothetical protein
MAASIWIRAPRHRLLRAASLWCSFRSTSWTFPTVLFVFVCAKPSLSLTWLITTRPYNLQDLNRSPASLYLVLYLQGQSSNPHSGTKPTPFWSLFRSDRWAPPVSLRQQPAPGQPPRPQRSATWARVFLGKKSLGLFSAFSKNYCKCAILQNPYLSNRISE